MSGQCVLYQYGDDPFSHHYKDHEGRTAFTISEAVGQPTIITRLRREDAWAALHPTIMGPDNCFFYFGPGRSQGHIAYGNNPRIQMSIFREQKKAESTTRYFKLQNRKEYKWRIISQHRMELIEGWNNCIGVWEVTSPGELPFARLSLRNSCLPIISEILTTLTLNRMASELGW